MNPEDIQETPQQAIEKYTTDFTKLASEGKLDPVIGREDDNLSFIRRGRYI